MTGFEFDGVVDTERVSRLFSQTPLYMSDTLTNMVFDSDIDFEPILMELDSGLTKYAVAALFVNEGQFEEFPGTEEGVNEGEWYLISGRLSVAPDSDSEMFVSEMQAGGKVFTGFGSPENFTDVVQSSVLDTGGFTAGNVLGVAEVQSKDTVRSGHMRVHFHTLVQDPLRD